MSLSFLLEEIGFRFETRVFVLVPLASTDASIKKACLGTERFWLPTISRQRSSTRFLPMSVDSRSPEQRAARTGRLDGLSTRAAVPSHEQKPKKRSETYNGAWP